jgi:Uri superfamily endonuclease
MSVQQFTIFGNKYRMGSYILLIRVSSPFKLAFGRFQNGALLAIPAGNYLYIGSALGGERSGSPLARRLIRHASRSGNRYPQQIRSSLLRLISENDFSGNTCCKPSEKKLRWHIDYLLDRPETEITHIVIIRSPEKLEHKLSELLEPRNETALLAPRLGAGDTRNSTHLLRFTDEEAILDLLRHSIPEIAAI